MYDWVMSRLVSMHAQFCMITYLKKIILFWSPCLCPVWHSESVIYGTREIVQKWKRAMAVSHKCAKVICQQGWLGMVLEIRDL